VAYPYTLAPSPPYALNAGLPFTDANRMMQTLRLDGVVELVTKGAGMTVALASMNCAAADPHACQPPHFGNAVFSRSTVCRHFGVIGWHTVFWLPNRPTS
jgi:hypothetical protein